MDESLFYINGNPDDFKVYYGDVMIGNCTAFNKGAIPFMISGNKLYIGEDGKSHGGIICYFLGMSEEEYNKKLDDAINSDDFNELQRLEELWEKAINKSNHDGCADGRIYLGIKGNKTNITFDYSIITFWGDKRGQDKDIDGNLVNELLSKCGVSADKVFVATFENGSNGTLIPYKKWSFYVPPMDETQKKAYVLHLMNARDKSNATAPFRKQRDMLRGRKLTNSKGEEMTDAQYRSLIYPNESVKTYKTIIREEINKFLLREYIDRLIYQHLLEKNWQLN